MSYQKYIAVGNLVDVIKIGEKVAKFSIAINDSKATLFWNCTMFLKNASDKQKELMSSFKKGKTLLFEGVINENEWEKDGVKRKQKEFIVHAFKFVSAPEKQDGDEKPLSSRDLGGKSGSNYDDDSIPF